LKAILIRHGHTGLNDTGTYFSTRDPGLDASGLRQVAALVGLLNDTQIDAIFSSPMQRAFQTALAIGRQRGIDVRTDDRLKEFNTGEFEGLNSRILQNKYPEFLEQWRTAPADLIWPGGESLRSTGQRFADILMEKLRDFDEKTVAFVSHGLAIKAVICLLTGRPLSDFREIAIDPTSYCVLDIRTDRVTQVVLNVSAGSSDT